MNKRRFIALILAIALPIIFVISTAAAWSHSYVPTLDLMAPNDPTSIASIVYYWYYDGDQGGGEEAGLGYSVSTAGDVNGDGNDDIIIGAPVYSQTTDLEGVAFVFYGPLPVPNAAPDWTFGSGQKGARLGAAAGTAGDVNGDGCDDVIIGAYAYDVGEQQAGQDAGRAYVFYGCLGAGNGLSTTPNWILDGEARNDYFGAAVGTAGDVNGDGYDDVIVGAPQHDNGEPNEGRVYVFLGTDVQTTTLFWSTESDQASALLGTSVGTAGDVNGDGYDDIIVGAPQYDNGEKDEGAAFVFYGSDSGISASWMSDSNQANAEFGTSVDTAGDVNGDGYDDIIIGAPAYTNTISSKGAAFAFYGSPAGLGTTADWEIGGGQQDSRLGISVGTAGDVNGDGYDDVIIGAHLYSTSYTSPSQQGGAFVFSGSDTGLLTTVYWSADGGKAGTEFGYSVGTAGDVNGDTYADVIIGAPRFRRSRILYGRAFVYRGTQDPPTFTITLPLVLRTSPP